MIQAIGYNSPYSSYNRIQLSDRNGQIDNDPQAASSPVSGQIQNAADNAAVSDIAGMQMDLKLDEIRPRENADIEDISLSLKQPAGFELKGSESDISSLDMKKAVSDMNKDQALWQYQYFVGSNSSLFESEDGTVIAKNSVQ